MVYLALQSNFRDDPGKHKASEASNVKTEREERTSQWRLAPCLPRKTKGPKLVPNPECGGRHIVMTPGPCYSTQHPKYFCCRKNGFNMECTQSCGIWRWSLGPGPVTAHIDSFFCMYCIPYFYICIPYFSIRIHIFHIYSISFP